MRKRILGIWRAGVVIAAVGLLLLSGGCGRHLQKNLTHVSDNGVSQKVRIDGLIEAMHVELDTSFDDNDKVLANTAFATPLERQMAAVVKIRSTGMGKEILGTGTCIDKERGLVMTCAHNVLDLYGSGEQYDAYVIESADGIATPARLVGYDTAYEVAVLEPVYRMVNSRRGGDAYLHRHLGYIAYEDTWTSDAPVVGRPVTGVGYTVQDGQEVRLLREGEVLADKVTDWADIEALITYSFGVELDLATIPSVECGFESVQGMSGGPIIDVDSGEPVGLMIYAYYYLDKSPRAAGPSWNAVLTRAWELIAEDSR